MGNGMLDGSRRDFGQEDLGVDADVSPDAGVDASADLAVEDAGLDVGPDASVDLATATPTFACGGEDTLGASSPAIALEPPATAAGAPFMEVVFVDALAGRRPVLVYVAAAELGGEPTLFAVEGSPSADSSSTGGCVWSEPTPLSVGRPLDPLGIDQIRVAYSRESGVVVAYPHTEADRTSVVVTTYAPSGGGGGIIAVGISSALALTDLRDFGDLPVDAGSMSSFELGVSRGRVVVAYVQSASDCVIDGEPTPCARLTHAIFESDGASPRIYRHPAYRDTYETVDVRPAIAFDEEGMVAIASASRLARLGTTGDGLETPAAGKIFFWSERLLVTSEVSSEYLLVSHSMFAEDGAVDPNMALAMAYDRGSFVLAVRANVDPEDLFDETWSSTEPADGLVVLSRDAHAPLGGTNGNFYDSWALEQSIRLSGEMSEWGGRMRLLIDDNHHRAVAIGHRAPSGITEPGPALVGRTSTTSFEWSALTHAERSEFGFASDGSDDRRFADVPMNASLDREGRPVIAFVGPRSVGGANVLWLKAFDPIVADAQPSCDLDRGAYLPMAEFAGFSEAEWQSVVLDDDGQPIVSWAMADSAGLGGFDLFARRWWRPDPDGDCRWTLPYLIARNRSEGESNIAAALLSTTYDSVQDRLAVTFVPPSPYECMGDVCGRDWLLRMIHADFETTVGPSEFEQELVGVDRAGYLQSMKIAAHDGLLGVVVSASETCETFNCVAPSYFTFSTTNGAPQEAARLGFLNLTPNTTLLNGIDPDLSYLEDGTAVVTWGETSHDDVASLQTHAIVIATRSVDALGAPFSARAAYEHSFAVGPARMPDYIYRWHSYAHVLRPDGGHWFLTTLVPPTTADGDLPAFSDPVDYIFYELAPSSGSLGVHPVTFPFDFSRVGLFADALTSSPLIASDYQPRSDADDGLGPFVGTFDSSYGVEGNRVVDADFVDAARSSSVTGAFFQARAAASGGLWVVFSAPFVSDGFDAGMPGGVYLWRF